MMATELHHQHNLNESWLNIIASSRDIEALADQQAWESLVAAAQQRHQNVVAHFKRFPVSPETAVFYMENLNDFMRHEERLQILVNQARQETIEAVGQFSKNRQAVSAYHSV